MQEPDCCLLAEQLNYAEGIPADKEDGRVVACSAEIQRVLSVQIENENINQHEASFHYNGSGIRR